MLCYNSSVVYMPVSSYQSVCRMSSRWEEHVSSLYFCFFFPLIWGQSTWYIHLYRGTWSDFETGKSSVQSCIRLSQVTRRPWLKKARIKVCDSSREVTTQPFFHHRILRHPDWDRADRWSLKQSRREQTGSGCLGHSICPQLTSAYEKNFGVGVYGLLQMLEQNWMLKSRTRLVTCSFTDVIVCVPYSGCVCAASPVSSRSSGGNHATVCCWTQSLWFRCWLLSIMPCKLLSITFNSFARLPCRTVRHIHHRSADSALFTCFSLHFTSRCSQGRMSARRPRCTVVKLTAAAAAVDAAVKTFSAHAEIVAFLLISHPARPERGCRHAHLQPRMDWRTWHSSGTLWDLG